MSYLTCVLIYYVIYSRDTATCDIIGAQQYNKDFFLQGVFLIVHIGIGTCIHIEH